VATGFEDEKGRFKDFLRMNMELRKGIDPGDELHPNIAIGAQQ
jgi:hypothetical protein